MSRRGKPALIFGLVVAIIDGLYKFGVPPVRVVPNRGARMISLFITLGLVLTASGCATILDGTSQIVTFNSQPNGVKILLNGAPVGVTPLSLQVKRSKNTIVVAKKDGYEDQQLALQTKTNTTFWGNIITGGFLGSTTDYVSGAIIEYSPNMYFFNLEPLKFSKPQTDQAQTERAPVGLSYERRIRNFILRNHVNLTSDIARGDGEYLSSLYSMLGLEEFEYGLALRRLKVLASRNREAPSFAQAVLKQFPQDGPFYASKSQSKTQARESQR